MLIQVGLENHVGERCVAWALDLPGCFAYGKDGGEALLNLPRAVVKHQDWIARHTPNSWLADLGDFDVRLVETFEAYTIDDAYELAREGYEVECFFRHDWKPLTELDVLRGLQLLSWSRADLLAVAAELTPEKLEEKQPGERWSINGILGHVGGAEWWYLHRLDRAGLTRDEVPKAPLERLAVVRARLEQALPGLVGVDLVVGKDGELWSPRKLLRRAIWHEMDHIGHISRLALS